MKHKILHLNLLTLISLLLFCTFAGAQESTLISSSFFEGYFENYQKVKKLKFDESADEASFESLKLHSDFLSDFQRVIFGVSFIGKKREDLLKSYANTFKILATYKNTHPEAVYELFYHSQQRWYLKYGFFDLKPWLRSGEQIGLASGILGGIFALSAVSRLKPSRAKEAFKWGAHFFPALGIWGGNQIAEVSHQREVLKFAPPPPNQFFDVKLKSEIVYDSSTDLSDQQMATALAWAGSVSSLTLSHKIAQWISRGKLAFKGTKWTLFGFASSAVLTSFLDDYVLTVLKRIRSNELHRNFYNAVNNLANFRNVHKDSDRFQRLVLSKTLLESTYQLFFYQIYRLQKAIQAFHQANESLESEFYESMKGFDPASGFYQKEKLALLRKQRVIEVTLSKELLGILNLTEYSWNSPFTRTKLRWLLLNDQADEITQYGPEAVELVNQWITKANQDESKDLAHSIQSEQKKEYELRASALEEYANKNQYLSNPTKTLFDVISLLKSFDESLLENDITEATVLLNAFESDLEVNLLRSAKPIPLSNEITFSKAQRYFERFNERHLEFKANARDSSIPQSVRLHFQKLAQSDAVGFAKILVHFDTIELNRFYLEFLSKKFTKSHLYWSSIQALTSELMGNADFITKLKKQVDFEIQSPALQFADKVVTTWIVVSFLRGGMNSLGIWNRLNSLKDKLIPWAKQEPGRIKKISDAYQKMHQKIYSATPTQFGKRIVHGAKPVIENLLVSVPIGSAWLWTEASLHSTLIDPMHSLGSWQLGALTGIYESWWIALKKIESFNQKTLEEDSNQVLEYLVDLEKKIESDFQKTLLLQSLNSEHRGFFELGIVTLQKQLKAQTLRWKTKAEKELKKRGNSKETDSSQDAPKKIK